MIVSQQNSCAGHSASTLAQWKIGVDYPADMVCSGPRYQYASADGVHLTAEGCRLLGEKYAGILYQRVILGKDWQPLQPTKVKRKGKIITIHYHVPVPPLVWETRFEAPHPTVEEWKQGKGFEVTTFERSQSRDCFRSHFRRCRRHHLCVGSRSRRAGRLRPVG